MKKILFFAAALAVVGLVSCDSNEKTDSAEETNAAANQETQTLSEGGEVIIIEDSTETAGSDNSQTEQTNQ